MITSKKNGQGRKPWQKLKPFKPCTRHLFSQNVPFNVEDKVENGINLSQLKLKRQNIDQTLSKLTGTSANPNMFRVILKMTTIDV
jgi:hypothetical protein